MGEADFVHTHMFHIVHCPIAYFRMGFVSWDSSEVLNHSDYALLAAQFLWKGPKDKGSSGMDMLVRYGRKIKCAHANIEAADQMLVFCRSQNFRAQENMTDSKVDFIFDKGSNHMIFSLSIHIHKRVATAKQWSVLPDCVFIVQKASRLR